MIKIRAKPGDVLFFLLYDLTGFSGWRPESEKFDDYEMQCRAVGIFKGLNKDSVVMHNLEMLTSDDKRRKKMYKSNDNNMIPLGTIKKYKNLGRVLDWPKLETKP